MDEATIREKSKEIVTKYIEAGGDLTTALAMEAMHAEIVAIALAASRPAPGYLRASEGADMRLLGTLPVTADGCVVGIGAELWCNAEEHGVFQWGSPPWVETSDAGWVFIDRDGADVAPQFMYSTRTAAESAKVYGHEGQPVDANEALLKAAPDAVEVCQKLVMLSSGAEDTDAYAEVPWSLIKTARGVLAKAVPQ